VQVSISTRHGDLSQEVQQKINDKVARLPRLFERLTAANVMIDLEHTESPEVEIRISVEHARDFVATETSASVIAALDGTIHKVEQQLRRHKKKLKGHKATGLKHQSVSDESENVETASQRRQDIRNHLMKFADFVSPDAIKAGMEADTKDGVIEEMVAALVAANQIAQDDTESILKAIKKREELGSTGIGRGVAVPHTKHPSVDRLIATVGISELGVDFDSLDGEKVQLFFLLVSPLDRPSDHLRALENISRQLRDNTFCRFLKQSKTVAEVKKLLEEADNNQFVS